MRIPFRDGELRPSLLDDEPGCLCMENGQVASLPSNMTMVFNMRFLLCV
jgi:hypothetical protein